jgi:hypothetical protein
MAIDPSHFELNNVTDTCAVWNVLSSLVLYSNASSAGCSFCLTQFVYYECLFKPRTNPTQEELDLQDRLRHERSKGAFQAYHLDIEDLQDIIILESRRRLSKGELSSIAFARKTRQAFLTDDQKARNLARQVIDRTMVQTTPHLFGWLCFINHLGDGDKDRIIHEHSQFNRPLSPYFEEMYHEALRCRLMSRSSS